MSEGEIRGEAKGARADGLGDAIGIEHLDSGDDFARARLPVTDAVRQPYGLVHGGAYSVLAESVTSRATFLSVMGEGKVALGQSNHATFLRPISSGVVHALARARHRGRSSWVWEVEISDDEGRLCALVQTVVAVRERREGGGG